MKWEKKGCIFKANGEFGWIKSHAQVPTALVKKNLIRIYFSPRPQPGSSCIAAMDLDINDPQHILQIYEKPILEHGKPGDFDEHGAMPQFVCEVDDKVYLLYAGWSRRESIPYSNWVGMAVSYDGGLTFEKCFNGPILDRTRYEILSGTGLFCIKEHGKWYGFYANGTMWYKNKEGGYDSAYEITNAESLDLISWTERTGVPILPKKKSSEANTRPTIIKINNRYHMWFCYRGIEDYHDGKEAYSIGYAWSDDLKKWYREDEKAGIEKSSSGWDSKMMAYPYVVCANGKYFMFYCGNGFGAEGFGYAQLDYCGE